MRLKTKLRPTFGFLHLISLIFVIYSETVIALTIDVEPVHACIIPTKIASTPREYQAIASCLEWVPDPQPLCRGEYRQTEINPIADRGEVHIEADKVTLSETGRSTLSGHVEVAQVNHIISAKTAYLYRDAKTKQITKIELTGLVKYQEPERFVIARKAVIYPQDKSGVIDDALYRFYTPRYFAILPAIGQAKRVERFPNEDYLLENATYTTCPPTDRAWLLRAKKIKIDKAEGRGIARDTTFYLGKVPVFYSPYLSFPTSKARKSGFLMPIGGYTTVGGADLSLPFYWNMAANYDATLTPHYFSRRGLMMEGEFRYLTPHSSGLMYGSFLNNDRALKQFIQNNVAFFPQIAGTSLDRYAIRWQEARQLAPNLNVGVNFEQVSDPYYFQDFTNNLALLTQRQLLKEGVVNFTTAHWLFRGMVQGYQTLNPINETPILDIYRRLPELLAEAHYDNLPFNASFDFLGQFDQYDWPSEALVALPEGPRFYLNPILSFPYERPFGHFTPSIQLVQRNYKVSPAIDWERHSFTSTIPRFSLDGGLVFERPLELFHYSLIQTFEPRIFYLNVPYQDQRAFPVYDSAYMIFNTGQLFRTNRFSGFDRIGDTNQLSYAFTMRWTSGITGDELANFTLGQIAYFANRKVFLCQSPTGFCYDNPMTLGFLSPTSKFSPIAANALYRFNKSWLATGDYVWDPARSGTNNSNVSIHYQPDLERTLTLGYTYLVNGDITLVENSFQPNSLHQASIGFSLPVSEKITTLGAYAYNLSKGYEMAAYLGLQYNSCCWATRLLVGRNFKSLDSFANPEYNSGVFLQILFKGLGTIENKNPIDVLNTYIPGYVGPF